MSVAKRSIFEEIEADASAFEGLTTDGGGELSDLIRTVSEVNHQLS